MNLTSIIVVVSHEDKIPTVKIFIIFQHIYVQKYSNVVVKYMILKGILTESVFRKGKFGTK